MDFGERRGRGFDENKIFPLVLLTWISLGIDMSFN